MKVLLWILFVISVVAVLAGVASVVYGSQPCSGDGCLIHIFQVFGVILLVLFGPICWLAGRKLDLWSKGQ